MLYHLSEASYRLQGQPMFKLLSKVQKMERSGANIIHFEIGDPDFSTPHNITQAAINSLLRGDTHYTSSKGVYDFRKAVIDITKQSRGFTPDIDQILITPGANIIIYYAIKTLVNPGDEIIVPDPGFPTYYSVINFCNAVPVRVPLKEENQFRMNPDDIEKAITDKTRLIIINSPQNPSGALMTPEEIKKIAEIAEKYDVYLYSDEIYSRMIFDETVPFSTPSYKDKCKKRTIIANGFSKAFAMTGWRLGVAIAPKDVIEKMALLLETTSSCVSPFIQYAGLEAMTGVQTETKKMIAAYKERRKIIVDGLNNINKISCLNPGGAFYVFPNIKQTGLTSEEFSDQVLEKAHVALLPGTNFGDQGEGYVRLCYANSKENIKEGLKRIEEFIGE